MEEKKHNKNSNTKTTNKRNISKRNSRGLTKSVVRCCLRVGFGGGEGKCPAGFPAASVSAAAAAANPTHVYTTQIKCCQTEQFATPANRLGGATASQPPGPVAAGLEMLAQCAAPPTRVEGCVWFGCVCVCCVFVVWASLICQPAAACLLMWCP